VGYGATIDKDNFFRTSGQGSYNYTLNTGSMRHDLHVGYQQYVDSEDLLRTTNGWGSISIPAGTVNSCPTVTAPCSVGTAGLPVYYRAAFAVQGFGNVPPNIHSEYRSQSIEFNDTITHNRVTVSLGVIDSHDKLYGQGLREDTSKYSGYVAAIGNKYLQYDIPWSKLIQPRLGATWAYDGKNTIWLGFAKYNPAASSLPRAASWDRNLAATVTADFDANGALIAVEPTPSSSGKLFVQNMTPPRVREFTLGTSRLLTDSVSLRVYSRYRKGDHYWEDTNNTARTNFNPPAGIPRELYIPDLTQRLAQIGSGSTYVIAELDGAYTKYWEVTAESEWRTKKTYVNASYTRSHYYGNFDQDNTAGASATGNDFNSFIGSSNIGDAGGRQLWDNKTGTLHGDRPHMFKIFGTYLLNWNATVGAYVIAQSGQAWEALNYLPYFALTGSTSETVRFDEPAGSRRTSAHSQMDLNYTQSFRLHKTQRLQLALDVFNVFNSQTGYNPDPREHSGTAPNPQFGVAQSYFDPRRAQVTVRFQF
jgi:hypothetical protein